MTRGAGPIRRRDQPPALTQWLLRAPPPQQKGALQNYYPQDKLLLARIRRDQRYWTQRRASACVVPTAAATPEVVRFGVNVVVHFGDDGTRRSFRLVGEDEADPANGLVSWVAPLGKALTGKAVGDEIQVVGRTAEIVALMA